MYDAFEENDSHTLQPDVEVISACLDGFHASLPYADPDASFKFFFLDERLKVADASELVLWQNKADLPSGEFRVTSNLSFYHWSLLCVAI